MKTTARVRCVPNAAVAFVMFVVGVPVGCTNCRSPQLESTAIPAPTTSSVGVRIAEPPCSWASISSKFDSPRDMKEEWDSAARGSWGPGVEPTNSLTVVFRGPTHPKEMAKKYGAVLGKLENPGHGVYSIHFESVDAAIVAVRRMNCDKEVGWAAMVVSYQASDSD